MTRVKDESVKQAQYVTDRSRWLAVARRERNADGAFVYAVATTGVYCRPTCPARLALRRNVTFFDAPADAERAGFRSCLRCRPKETSALRPHIQAATNACRMIENGSAAPTLDELAGAAGMSRYHFHRVFKKIVGLTPRQYAAAHAARRVKSALRKGQPITRAAYTAGFNSSGRFYEKTPAMLGMTPGQYRDGGAGVHIGYAIAPCRLGLVLVAGTARGICCVRFGESRPALRAGLRRDFAQAAIEESAAGVREWVRAVVAHIEDPSNSIDLPLDIRGTAFQQRVWQALQAIPPGQTSTYSEIARRIGMPTAARAVARVCATNPAAVIVPCHRVVRSDGSLSGYFWGVERKRKLLEREKASADVKKLPTFPI